MLRTGIYDRDWRKLRTHPVNCFEPIFFVQIRIQNHDPTALIGRAKIDHAIAPGCNHLAITCDLKDSIDVHTVLNEGNGRTTVAHPTHGVEGIASDLILRVFVGRLSSGPNSRNDVP